MNWVAFFTALVGFGVIGLACAGLIRLMDRIESRYSFTTALYTGVTLAALASATIAGVLAS